MLNAKEIAKELRDKLNEYEDFEGLYLYGSQAQGTASPDSDIDIAAVFSTDRTFDLEIDYKVYDLELKYDILIDFHAFTPQTLEKNYIYNREIKKGIYYA